MGSCIALRLSLGARRTIVRQINEEQTAQKGSDARRAQIDERGVLGVVRRSEAIERNEADGPFFSGLLKER